MRNVKTKQPLPVFLVNLFRNEIFATIFSNTEFLGFRVNIEVYKLKVLSSVTAFRPSTTLHLRAGSSWYVLSVPGAMAPNHALLLILRIFFVLIAAVIIPPTLMAVSKTQQIIKLSALLKMRMNIFLLTRRGVQNIPNCLI